jgi:CRISPR/Cas system CSM-associated protein Csm3 (group 7 of RAMP superfamily)
MASENSSANVNVSREEEKSDEYEEHKSNEKEEKKNEKIVTRYIFRDTFNDDGTISRDFTRVPSK